MNIDKITSMLQESGVTALVGNARFGYHTLPDGMVDAYGEFEQYVADHFNKWGTADDPAAIRTTQAMADSLASRIAYGNADAVIVEHLQPAMAQLLADVVADREAAGRHALTITTSIDMLSEPEHVRAAIVRLSKLHPRYHGLRHSWEVLRTRDTLPMHDPLGLRSPLAEVGNLPDVFADWERAAHGRVPWPWHSSHLAVKLGWLLDNGGHIWLPTAAEQTGAWKRYNPAPTAKAAA